MSGGPFLAFGGFRAHAGTIIMPYTGAWVADLTFADTTELASTAALTCGDLTLVGTIYRQAEFAGQRVARIVAGYGGWHRTAPARAYRLSGAVSLSLVATDLANEVGEKVSVGTDRVLGDYFVRETAPAQRILRQLAGLGWYVDNAGVTQIRTRPSVGVTGDFLVQSFDPAHGELVVSTESYSEWQPGNTFSNALVTDTQTIGLVRIETDNEGKLRHTVLVGGPDTDLDRMMSAIRELVRGEVSRLQFLGIYGYVVLSSDGDTVTCRPINASLSLPPLVSIPLRNGASGLDCKPHSGDVLAVAFLDGEPTQPRVMGGMKPAAHSRAVVCYGDRVSGGPLTDVQILPGTTQELEMAALPVTVKAARLTSL
jgi:hypothetical protein